MQQIIINIKDENKAKYFIDFLKQIDFISIEKNENEIKLKEISEEIIESVNNVKNNKVKSWKNKKIVLKDA